MHSINFMNLFSPNKPQRYNDIDCIFADNRNPFGPQFASLGDENKQLKWNQQNETNRIRKGHKKKINNFMRKTTLQWRRQTTMESWKVKLWLMNIHTFGK